MTNAPAASRTPRHPGSIFLFQAFGIPVFVHWTWGLLLAFVVATNLFGMGPVMGVVALIGLFAIVTLHEYGHALAAKSVGGTADRIVLMPLGGLAYAQAPPRPWPFLWTIVAGPLVNVLLIPVSILVVLALGAYPSLVEVTDAAGQTSTVLSTHGLSPVQELTLLLAVINASLLVFNMLPIYPLDGGQTLQGILWLFIGRASSLRVAATIGLVVSVAVGVLMLATWFSFGSPFLFLIAIFLALQSWRSLAVARFLAAMENEQGRHVEPWELRVGGAERSQPGGPFGGGRRGDEVIEGEVVDRR
ncbi:MAG: site-2 protease family protein [Planctomycetota bacterium]